MKAPRSFGKTFYVVMVMEVYSRYFLGGILWFLISLAGFPYCLVVNNPPANAGDAGDTGLIPGSRRSPGVGNVNLLQYSCLENHIDRGAR